MGYSRCSDEPKWLNVAKIWRSKHGSVTCRHYHVVGLREEDVLLDDTHVGRLPQFPPAPLSQLPNSLGHLPTEFFFSARHDSEWTVTARGLRAVPIDLGREGRREPTARVAKLRGGVALTTDDDRNDL